MEGGKLTHPFLARLWRISPGLARRGGRREQLSRTPFGARCPWNRTGRRRENIETDTHKSLGNTHTRALLPTSLFGAASSMPSGETVDPAAQRIGKEEGFSKSAQSAQFQSAGKLIGRFSARAAKSLAPSSKTDLRRREDEHTLQGPRGDEKYCGLGKTRGRVYPLARGTY